MARCHFVRVFHFLRKGGLADGRLIFLIGLYLMRAFLHFFLSVQLAHNSLSFSGLVLLSCTNSAFYFDRLIFFVFFLLCTEFVRYRTPIHLPKCWPL